MRLRWPSDLEPKLVTVLREGISREQLLRDVLAGLVVGVVAVPLAIAFAIASGLRPEQGLYTAIVAGFLISVFGGSRVQIGGPTGAFVVLVASVVERHGVEGLVVATALAGVILVPGRGEPGLAALRRAWSTRRRCSPCSSSPARGQLGFRSPPSPASCWWWPTT